MTGFWKKINSPAASKVFASALAIFGSLVFFLHYRGVWSTWFINEDSRFFANGLFSFYDLWSAFATPMNSMGQYRPITKALWGIPYWLGSLNPVHFHAISLGMLSLSAAVVARLHFLWFQERIFAVFAAVLFALMPVHAKPMYWISAWHNTAVCFFILSALYFRMEQWRQPKYERLFRILTLSSLILALASREVAFAVGPLLLLVDFREKKLRRSWDVIFILAFFLWFVFLRESPFARASIKPDFSLFLAPQKMLHMFWDYARAVPWSLNELREFHYGFIRTVLSGLVLILSLLGPVFHRGLVIPSLLVYAGIAPFLLLNVMALEYGVLLGAGVVFVGTGTLALLAKKIKNTAAIAFVLAVFGSCTYYTYLAPSRFIFRQYYTERSLVLRNFIDELKKFGKQLPPYRPIHIVDFGPYRSSQAASTNHFLSSGLDELIPNRIFIFNNEALGIIEGTGWKDPNVSIWNDFRKFNTPMLVRYTEQGFKK